MIRILEDMKKDDPKLYNQVERELDKFGGSSSKGYFNKLTYPDYLDLISFADSYSFQPAEYEMVMNILSDLTPTENTMMGAVKSCQPKDKKALMALNTLQNNRTRQHVLKIINDLSIEKPSSFMQALANFKHTVLG